MNTLAGNRWILVLVLPFLLVALAPTGGVTTDPEIRHDRQQCRFQSHPRYSDYSSELPHTSGVLRRTRARSWWVTAARNYLFSRYSAIPGLQVRLDHLCLPAVRPCRPTM
jgi:hypothetical protein